MSTQATAPNKTRAGSRPSARFRPGFELYLWFFTRVSGVLLLLLTAFNLVYANLMGGRGNLDAGAQMRWAFFPISFHVSSTKVEVTPNFSNPFWQAYTFLVIALAATHAWNGLRIIFSDYIRHPLLLAWVKALLAWIWLTLLVAAVFVIFVFNQ
jgi:succinate dehydrogenase / fumarate reductase membrane anchor subunit